MKYYKCFLIYILFIYGCTSNSTEENTESYPVDNIIHLSDAIDSVRPVKLSEIADTLIYLPLETDSKGKNLIKDRSMIKFSGNFIFINTLAFNWDGKFLFEVGKRGNGPGEEMYLRRIISNKNELYSLCDKLIRYDKNGKYSGKERKLSFDLLILDLMNADSNLVLGSGDTIYFMTPDFNIIKERRIVEPWPEKTTTFNIDQVVTFFSENNDSALYYNYSNDTIFRILNDDLSPRWVVELKEDKIALKHLLGNEGERIHTGSKYFQNNNLEDWDYLKGTDNKIRSYAVFETDDYLIIQWLKMREFWQLRKVERNFPQVAFYNKKTGKTIAVDKRGFIDDLSSLDTFYPLWGTHENFMISSYWPYQLREKAKALEASGKPIDKNLSNLLSVIKDDDNPVLVMVRLKEK